MGKGGDNYLNFRYIIWPKVLNRKTKSYLEIKRKCCHKFEIIRRWIAKKFMRIGDRKQASIRT